MDREEIMDPIKNKFLKAAIKRAGLKQKQVAYRIGIAESKLSNIVNGYTRVTEEEASDISSMLGEPVSKLFPDSLKGD